MRWRYWGSLILVVLFVIASVELLVRGEAAESDLEARLFGAGTLLAVGGFAIMALAAYVYKRKIAGRGEGPG